MVCAHFHLSHGCESHTARAWNLFSWKEIWGKSFFFFFLFFEKQDRTIFLWIRKAQLLWSPPICFPTGWHIFTKQPLEAREKKERKKVAVKKSKVMGRSKGSCCNVWSAHLIQNMQLLRKFVQYASATAKKASEVSLAPILCYTEIV